MENEEDILLRKMMLDIQRKLVAKSSPKKEEKIDYSKVFLENLSEDGKEMFERALKQYSDAALKIAEILGRLIIEKKVTGPFDAEAVYGIFEELGLPIRIETKIVYKKKGKIKSISELIREEE